MCLEMESNPTNYDLLNTSYTAMIALSQKVNNELRDILQNIGE